MKNYCIVILALMGLGFYSNQSYAQQDAQYTQYMYNTLSVNPAYAGSRDVLSFIGLYRTQWVGLDGAPDTFTASLHSPVGEKVGLGLNITQDDIFITSETYIDLSFSYTLDLDNDAKLALGIKAGAHLLNIDTNKLNTGAFNPGDANTEINIDNKFSPQFGLGLYYYTDKFYLGLSAPNILETEHFDENAANNDSFATAKEKVNFYVMAGKTFDINDDLKFKPSTLFKFVDGAPFQVDLSANFLIKEKLTLGLAYRWSAAMSAMAGFQISDQLMLGVAYDRETTELKQYNDGSFEIFLRFELFKRSNRMISPRFF
ncbi:type IX secretion system membrane protein PorP/SprF [Psychroserpens sp. NJDZ02]|uniref:PorP/SprF family type IX secretion system membrane protein n=1 Tax=Psychroserpens sp. NJDZ02 TaxID=2570561 RepID=UPI0010A8185C|nr:type IX secretion system membrane protein PorP/SprF [Psychroserpens sp. NJDZ02]QCE41034.1 type IX secretion system membrane protein PorP/SprF [Psychroserpens sp. NJDZ02]